MTFPRGREKQHLSIAAAGCPDYTVMDGSSRGAVAPQARTKHAKAEQENRRRLWRRRGAAVRNDSDLTVEQWSEARWGD